MTKDEEHMCAMGGGGRDVPPKNRVSKTEEHIICCKKCSGITRYTFDTLVVDSVELVYIWCSWCELRIEFELSDFPKGYTWLISDILFPNAEARKPTGVYVSKYSDTGQKPWAVKHYYKEKS